MRLWPDELSAWEDRWEAWRAENEARREQELYQPRLPADVARCNGVGSDAEGWREGCEDCARRLATAPGDVPLMQPPEIIAFDCEYRIPIERAGCAQNDTTTKENEA